MQDLVTEMDSRTAEINVVGELDAHKIEVSVSQAQWSVQVSVYQSHIDMMLTLKVILLNNSCN